MSTCIGITMEIRKGIFMGKLVKKPRRNIIKFAISYDPPKKQKQKKLCHMKWEIKREKD